MAISALERVIHSSFSHKGICIKMLMLVDCICCFEVTSIPHMEIPYIPVSEPGKHTDSGTSAQAHLCYSELGIK